MVSEKGRTRNAATNVLHVGRNPEEQRGFVNPAIYRGSTVIFPTLEALKTASSEFTYGRTGTPTILNLEKAIAELEGGSRTVLTPSGLAAISTALLAFVKAGDHILVSDSVYAPTRRFCLRMLKPLGVETTFYDPLIGTGIHSLIRNNTVLIFTESPGSQTFEVMDIPAIVSIAKAKGLVVIADNTWASPLYFRPIEHGVDVSIQSATKYIAGHADVMLGAVTCNQETAEKVKAAHMILGLCPGPDDAFLALRGLRTLAVRLERHWHSGVEVAAWLKGRPEVDRVIHPALPEDQGHALWRRDFDGASGVFSFTLKPVPEKALAAFLDHLELFAMGYSWGGFESLLIPFNPQSYRSATRWDSDGPALRIHVGLDDVNDLKADLEAGFVRMASAG